MTDIQPILEVKHIHKTINGKQILKDVSLVINKGELKLLIGPSGGGKSTLLKCINHLVRPDSGALVLNGTPVNLTSKRELSLYRQEVGMIFQEFNLFDHLTALDNVAVALRKVKKMSKEQARKIAREELDVVGLADRGHLYPAELSGGQKQRVSIARALAMQPKVLLLDEPTSALDPELISEVLMVISKLAREGMTMIMATHQIGFARALASEVYFMEHGEIIEHGSPTALFADGNSRSWEFCAKLNELIS